MNAHNGKSLEFFAKNPVFRHEDFLAASAARGRTKATANNLRALHLASGRLLRVRRGLYAVRPPAVESTPAEADPYLVASKLQDDAVIAYHASLQFHGKAYSLWQKYFARTPPVAEAGVDFGQPSPDETTALGLRVGGRVVGALVAERGRSEEPWHPSALAVLAHTARLRLELDLVQRRRSAQTGPGLSRETSIPESPPPSRATAAPEISSGLAPVLEPEPARETASPAVDPRRSTKRGATPASSPPTSGSTTRKP